MSAVVADSGGSVGEFRSIIAYFGGASMASTSSSSSLRFSLTTVSSSFFLRNARYSPEGLRGALLGS